MEKQNKGKADLRKIWLIFINTLMISSTANSGYAMIGVMERVFVKKHEMLSKEELSDCTAMAASSPGRRCTLARSPQVSRNGRASSMSWAAVSVVVIVCLLLGWFRVVVAVSGVKVFFARPTA